MLHRFEQYKQIYLSSKIGLVKREGKKRAMVFSDYEKNLPQKED